MPCEACGADTIVADVRRATMAGVPVLRRRRSCPRCGHRVTTYELSNELALSVGQLLTLARKVQMPDPAPFPSIKSRVRKEVI